MSNSSIDSKKDSQKGQQAYSFKEKIGRRIRCRIYRPLGDMESGEVYYKPVKTVQVPVTRTSFTYAGQEYYIMNRMHGEKMGVFGGEIATLEYRLGDPIPLAKHPSKVHLDAEESLAIHHRKAITNLLPKNDFMIMLMALILGVGVVILAGALSFVYSDASQKDTIIANLNGQITALKKANGIQEPQTPRPPN